jgi:chromate transporter
MLANEPACRNAPGLVSDATPATTDVLASRPAGPGELFLAFTGLALQGFGGVLPVAQRVLVEERRWLTRAEFLELLSVAQVLPGPNICNLSILAGHRFFGIRGALAALGGLLAVPAVVVLCLSATQRHLASHPAVAGAVRGISAVSAGLIAGTALKLAAGLRGAALGAPASLLLGAAAFVLVAVLHVHLAWALLVVGLPAWGLAAWKLAGAGRGGAP